MAEQRNPTGAPVANRPADGTATDGTTTDGTTTDGANKDGATTVAAERLFSLLGERATDNPGDVAVLERLGRTFSTATASSGPAETEGTP